MLGFAGFQGQFTKPLVPNGAIQAVLFMRNSDQVNLVRYQIPGLKINLVFMTPEGHQFDIGLVILMAEEDRLATICRKLKK